MIIFSILNIIICFLLIFLSYPIFNNYFIDKPNSRSSHEKPIPTGLGAVFVTTIIVSLSILKIYYPLLLLPLVFIGLIDDKFKLNTKIRFAFQFLTTIFLIYFSPIYELIRINEGIFFIIITLFLILFGMAIINFTNFIDGIDGLLASNISVTFFCMSILIDMHYLIICGSLIGFLIWNWSPAKIFMGDAGSTFLGGMLFFGILSCRELDQSIGILMISSPILIDPFICIIRRFMNKQEIFLPHKQHFYQRLNQAGWTHNKVSILYLICSLSISLSYLIYGLKFSIFTFMVCFSYCFWLNLKIAVPFRK